MKIRIILFVFSCLAAVDCFSQQGPWLLDFNAYSLNHVTKSSSTVLEYPEFVSYGKSLGLGYFYNKSLMSIHIDRFESTSPAAIPSEIYGPMQTRSGVVDYLYGLNFNYSYLVVDRAFKVGIGGGTSFFYLPNSFQTLETQLDYDNDGIFEYQVHTNFENNARLYATLNGNIHISVDIFKRIHIYSEIFGQVATNSFMKMNSTAVTPLGQYSSSGLVSATGYGAKIGIGLLFY